MKILEDLWYGNIAPAEHSIKEEGRVRELGKQILQSEEELTPLLSEKAKEILENQRIKELERNSLLEYDAFVSGFRLGALIILEIIQDRNN